MNYNENKDKSRAWLEINLEHLKHNTKVLQNIMPDRCTFMAVVKANAYGHGDVETAVCLNAIGIHSFAVATIDEGIRLRENNILGEILVLGYTDVNRAKELADYDLMQTVIDYSYGVDLSRQGYPISVHIKIDTGMHRLGLGEDEYKKAIEIFHLKELKVEGIFTHLCVAESQEKEDRNYTHKQITAFYEFLEHIKQAGIILPKIHIQSSYGLLNYPELQCDYARIGIALYGSLSSIHDKCTLTPNLKPVLSLKAKVALTKILYPGESLSYGRTYTATQVTKVAILPIGYGDGLPRNLSNGRAEVILKNKKVPIIGRICMDQLIIDVTELDNIQRGDIATIIGKEKDQEILAAEVAVAGETIANELLCRLGSRLNRIYI